MVRTKANAGIKAVGAKAPRKQVGGSSSSGSSMSSPTSSGKSKYAGGNPVKWWPSPSWQKGIGTFFSTDNSTCTSTSPEENGTSSNQPGVSSEDLGITELEED